MQINRKSIVAGLTIGVLAGGAGGAIAATTGTGSGASAKTGSWTAGGWNGPGDWGGGYDGGWDGSTGWSGSAGWSGSSGDDGAWAGYAGGGATFARVGREAAQAYLGLSASQLRSRLDSGKTLAQIASDRGRSVSGLEAAIEAAVRHSITSDNALSADQRSVLLAHVRTVVDAIVTGTGPVAAWGPMTNRGW